MDTQTQMARRIRELARQRGLSQGLLADFSGVGRSNLSLILSGRRSPTLKTIQRIAAALRVEVYELFIPEKFDRRS